MKYTHLAVLLLAAACGAASAQTKPAPVAADAGAGVHAMCKDGTPYEGKTLKGACRGHGGVDKSAKPGAAAPAAGTANPAAAAAPAPAKSAAAPTKPAPAAAPVAAAPAAPAAPMMQGGKPMMAGGAAGQVWGNDDSKIYHCMGDHNYGKTKKGHYMSEADAQAQGYRPDHNKNCAQR